MTLKQIWCGALGRRMVRQLCSTTRPAWQRRPHLARVLLYFNSTMSFHFSTPRGSCALAIVRAQRQVQFFGWNPSSGSSVIFALMNKLAFEWTSIALHLSSDIIYGHIAIGIVAIVRCTFSGHFSSSLGFISTPNSFFWLLRRHRWTRWSACVHTDDVPGLDFGSVGFRLARNTSASQIKYIILSSSADTKWNLMVSTIFRLRSELK